MKGTESPETRYAITADQAHVAYQVTGKGPLDLLEFPLMPQTIDATNEQPRWQRFEERLASFSRLIRFDPRGIGLSDPHDQAAPITVEAQVDEAIAVLDAAQSRSAAVLAGTVGGYGALLLAATHPERVAALVLVHVMARVLEAPDYPWGRSEEEWGALRDVVTPAGKPAYDDVGQLAPSLANDVAFREWWVRTGRRSRSPATAMRRMVAVMDVDLRAVLPSIQAPTLVLHRSGNRFVDPRHSRYLAERIPGARLVELSGSDHLLWLGDGDGALDEIEEFLTGARRSASRDRALLTMLMVDIVGSTERAVALGDVAWRDLLDRHDGAIRRALARFGGTEVDTAGDGFLASFERPARAIACACAIRDGAAAIGLQVRAGLHTGEVTLRGGHVSGIAVHVTARVSALAGPGEVFVSRTVKDLIAGSGISLADRGTHQLKGVPDAWQLFSVTAPA